MSVKKIGIGEKTVGIIDLEESFEEVKRLGIRYEKGLVDILYRIVQGRNYIPSGMEALYREALLEEYRIYTGEAQRKDARQGFIEIRLYGTSCFNCEKLDEMVKDILSRKGVKADYLHVTDMRDVAQAGILQVPALVVNGVRVLEGRIPQKHELETMLMRTLEKPR